MSALPKPLLLQLDRIPEELINIPQWVCWKYKPARGEYTKTPINPKTGTFASTTNRKTWGTFQECLAAMERLGLPGIGFVFSEDDPYCGIDLDDCINPKTGQVADWADQIVTEIDSYAEVSPSGTGVKLFTRASLPVDGRRRIGNIEMYDHARFFTVTGHQLPDTPDVIKDRVKAVNDLYERLFPPEQEPADIPVRITARSDFDDDELIERAQNARNGHKFTQLWSGDTTGYSSQSEADLALCSMIAFWAGPDEAQIDRIFRRSGLYRQKWEREDYRANTITMAIDRTDFWEPGSPTLVMMVYDLTDAVEVKESPHPYIISVTDLLGEPDEPERWLVENFWRDQTMGLIVGPPKTMKSFLAIEMAVSIASGTPMLGQFYVPEPQTVVYIQEESARRYVRKRFAGVMAGKGIHPESVRDTLFTITNQRFRLDDPEHIQRLISEAIDAYNPVLVILDPLREMHWQDENKAETMMPMLRVMKDLRDNYGTSIAIVHHNNKNPEYTNPADSIRGSGAIWAAMDAGIFIGHTSDDDQMKVSVVLKEGGQVEPFLFSLENDDEEITFRVIEVEDAKKTISDSEIVQALSRMGGWNGVKEVSEACQMSVRRLQPRLNAMAGRGLIEKKTGNRGKLLYGVMGDDDDEPTF